MVRKTLSRLLVLVVLVAVFGAFASPAWAAKFVVDRFEDPDPTTADDCTASDGNDCSLRGSVLAANGASGEDTITVPNGTYTLTILASGGFDPNDGTTGDLDILDEVTIDGAGARSTIVTGGEGFDDRIFDVPPEEEAVGDIAEVPSDVEAEISGLTITGGNVADFGGGVRNAGAFLLLEESTVSGNTSSVDGGGIRNDGTLRISRVTVRDNESDSFGGGILNDGETDTAEVTGAGLEGPGNLEIVNSTVSGNAAPEGGGMINANDGQLSLTNVTLNNNSAEQGSNFSGGFAATAFENTIVANAQGGGENCATDPKMPIDSLGNNLDDDGSCGFDRPSDINNENPRLGPLQDNGGPTDTHALKARSPAIDAGGGAACPNRDQRGVKRQDGDGNGKAVCDIGAYEFEIPNTAPVAVDDRYVINEDQTISVRSPGILINDRDPDGDKLEAALVSKPKHGKAKLDGNGSFTYKPDNNFDGTNAFEYEVSDGNGGTDTARVTIRVRPAGG